MKSLFIYLSVVSNPPSSLLSPSSPPLNEMGLSKQAHRTVRMLRGRRAMVGVLLLTLSLWGL